MSDHLEANEGTSIGAFAASVLAYLDVVLVVLAAPVAIALGASPLGYLIAAGAWVLQRVLQQFDRRLIAGRGADARFGLNLVDGFGRIWLLAGAIVLAAVIGGRSDGLTAALVIFCVYSIAFAMRVVEGRPGGARR
ncbi:MAG: hypothetical protein ACRDK7_03785 [Solirubrobacteraceae bacterium]